MYDANLSYDENYNQGPFAHLLPDQRFPKIKFTAPCRYSFLGIPLHLPLGVAAGPLLNSNFLQIALDAGFCMPTYKTVRSRKYTCHPWPNVLKLNFHEKSIYADSTNHVTAGFFKPEDYALKDLSISNSFGVPSQSPEKWASDFMRIQNNEGKHVTLSFQGTLPYADEQSSLLDDVENIARLVNNTLTQQGSILAEVNLSCPNEKNTPIYKNSTHCAAILQTIKKTFGNSPVKLIAKIGVLSPQECFEFVEKCFPYLDAISAINTVSAQILDQNGKIILGSGSQSGGVCGSLILQQGLKMTSLLSSVREKLSIKKERLGLIGVGGVQSPQHVEMYINAGADIVQCATGMMWDLSLPQKIAEFYRVPFEQK